MQRNKIYKTREWAKVREQVLKMDHYECVRCNHSMFDKKGEKRLTPAVLVHHIYEAEKFPQYKYSIWVNGKRNLVSLCFDCHEELHDRRRKKKELQFTNDERFD